MHVSGVEPGNHLLVLASSPARLLHPKMAFVSQRCISVILHVECLYPLPIRCLLKWLEIRSVCPMCNKPILRLHTDAPQGAEGPMDPEEV